MTAERHCLHTLLFALPLAGPATLLASADGGGAGTETSGARSFDSFLNAFPASVWRTYTPVDSVGLSAGGRGKVALALCRQNADGSVTVADRATLELAERPADTGLRASLAEPAERLFLRVEPFESGACLNQAAFFTETPPLADSLRIAIVICTFRRPGFVTENAAKLLAFLDAWPGQCPYTLIVVDNDASLELPAHPRLTLLHNRRNTGGSGGFARGMLEAYKDPRLTHVLLLDDDIVFAPEILLRLHALLRYSREPRLAVGGILLSLADPGTVLEWNSKFDGHPYFPSRGLDVARAPNAAPLLREPDYCAWTLFCYPAGERALPLPLFVRYDDCEFSLRNDFVLLKTPAVCIWHTPTRRDSAFMLYLCHRNEALVNCLYACPVVRSYGRALLTAFSQAMLYRYATARAGLRGLRDFLRGPGQFKNNDYAALLKEFAAWPEQDAVLDGIADGIEYDAEDCERNLRKRSTFWTRLASLLTLNGHLLPASKATRHLPRQDGPNRFPVVFRAGRVVYWNEDGRTGIVCARSVAQCLLVLAEIAWTGVLLACCFRVVKKRYQAAFPELVSENFWKAYLELEPRPAARHTSAYAQELLVELVGREVPVAPVRKRSAWSERLLFRKGRRGGLLWIAYYTLRRGPGLARAVWGGLFGNKDELCAK